MNSFQLRGRASEGIGRGKMAGYLWAVTGAAAAFAVFAAIDFAADVWAMSSGLDLLSELAGVVVISVVFGMYGWVFAFLTAWPLFFLTTSLAKTLKTSSAVYFLISGAVTGVVLSLPLLALPRDHDDQRTEFETILRVVTLCVAYGMSGAWLFWWKIIRSKPAG